MKIAISSDKTIGIAQTLVNKVKEKGHEVILYGSLNTNDNPEWAWASSAVAKAVSEGKADQGIVCCFTGTGATIAANKIKNIRAALCVDSFTAKGAREWNNANVLGISLRLTTETLLDEILDAWFSSEPDGSQEENIKHVDEL